MKDIIIVGGGLTGLVAAYTLQQNGINNFLLLEAQSRFGGRIDTLYHESLPIELGPTWVHANHFELLELLKDLGIPVFSQYNEGIAKYEMQGQVQSFIPPGGQAVSYRIGGGSVQLTDKLSQYLNGDQYRLSTEVKSINEQDGSLMIKDQEGNKYEGKKVVVTLPPRLAIENISFDPALPDNLQKLMHSTYTWMSTYIKSAVVYDHPFWKEMGFSGMAFSQDGPMTEVYDHSDINDEKYALQGFVSPEERYMTLSKKEREKRIIRQLVGFFGPEAGEYVAYYEKNWNSDQYSSVEGDKLIPSKHLYGHELYQKHYLNEKLKFAGTETAPDSGGFMEGAVIAGKQAANFVSV
ncbi:FAD-dependent oxidoreductase [Mangrovivirga sp. M17]|uniref:FAD-dependent oxidoreductase n=1 Tax=Mangrovivirga halotolerans TaxID=2993936 RepID=A0ABT3RNJ0_9BACT|nr:FAD-dependent oxidoreductase [Mangrovivirga halotolerans]MCX2743344.1 FAD-dependent oxidoreductase [Mangrovivirga halotolerans]